MYGLIIGIILFVCVLLVLIVLVQNPKGGGLASSFSSSNQFMGVKRTADFIEKATWGFAAALLILSVAATMLPRNTGVQKQTKVQVEAPVDPGSIPAYPTSPAEQQPVEQQPQQ